MGAAPDPRDTNMIVQSAAAPYLKKVLVMPVRFPIFPGALITCVITDKYLIRILSKRQARNAFVGVFFVKEKNVEGKDAPIVDATRVTRKQARKARRAAKKLQAVAGTQGELPSLLGATMPITDPGPGPNAFIPRLVSSAATDTDDLHPIGVLASVRLKKEHPGGAAGPASMVLTLLGHRRIAITKRQRLSPMRDNFMVRIEHHREKDYQRERERTLEESEIHQEAHEVATFQRDIAQLMSDFLPSQPLYYQRYLHFNHYCDLSQPSLLADCVAGIFDPTAEELQEILQTLAVRDRLLRSLIVIQKAIQRSQVQQVISDRTKTIIDHSLTRFALETQLVAIQKSLGESSLSSSAANTSTTKLTEPNSDPTDPTNPTSSLSVQVPLGGGNFWGSNIGRTSKKAESLSKKVKQNLKGKSIPKEVQLTIDDELQNVRSLREDSDAFDISVKYLEWLTCLPWGIYSSDNLDMSHAESILVKDHYGLSNVKERILEFIAVANLKGGLPQGKILCLVGPPGVGKSSVARSIARALQRKYFRISLGGSNFGPQARFWE